jgi:hypothetical protein
LAQATLQQSNKKKLLRKALRIAAVKLQCFVDSGDTMLAVQLLIAGLFLLCANVVGRTIKDDLRQLYTKSGRILIGTMLGDVEQIRLGHNEGGNPDALLEPYFGEMVVKIGKPYVDFPSCPAFHLALNLGYKQHLNAAVLLLNLGADPNLYHLPESDSNQPASPWFNRGYPPALLFALGLGQEPLNSHAGILERIAATHPTAFNRTTINRWRAETGNPPLVHVALMTDHIDGAHVLLKRFGISADEADDHGVTALHVAAWIGNVPAVIMLLQHGANVNAVDVHGRTALHYVVMRGHPLPAAEILLVSTEFATQCAKHDERCKAKLKTKLLTAVDKSGHTAYELAVMPPGNPALREFLHSQAQPTTAEVSRVHTAGKNADNAAVSLAQRLSSTNVHALAVDTVDMGALSQDVQRPISTGPARPTRFYREYYTTQRPVLVTRQPAEQPAAWDSGDRDEFIARYGALRAQVGPGALPYAVLQPGEAQDTCSASTALGEPQCGVQRVGLGDYISTCFAAQSSSTTAGSVGTPGATSPPVSTQICRGPAHVSDASMQLPDAFVQDFPVPELFSSICTVPEDAVSAPASSNQHIDGGGATTTVSPQRKWRRNGVVEPLHMHAAPAATMTPFQAHNASWHLQLTGRTKWFLVPPGADIGHILNHAGVGNATNQTTGGAGSDVEQLLEAVVALRVLRIVAEVVQSPGEIVFIPHDWKYAQLHLEDAVAVSQQFCTFLHSDARIQPLGTVLYGGEDPFRGLGLYKTHKNSKYEIGVTLPATSKIPHFDFAPVT